MNHNGALEVKIHRILNGSVEYAMSGESIASSTSDFAVWLLRMQESGMELLLREKEGGIYARAETIDGVLVSSGTARFLQEADRLGTAYALNHDRRGANAATMAYAKLEQQEGRNVRYVLYFLLFSQPNKEQIPNETLRKATGVTMPDRAKKAALGLLKNEMALPAFAPFLTPQFRTLTRIIFDEASLARPEPHGFSTGIPPEIGGGYVHLTMSDAYLALSRLHNDNVSLAKLL